MSVPEDHERLTVLIEAAASRADRLHTRTGDLEARILRTHAATLRDAPADDAARAAYYTWLDANPGEIAKLIVSATVSALHHADIGDAENAALMSFARALDERRMDDVRDDDRAAALAESISTGGISHPVIVDTFRAVRMSALAAHVTRMPAATDPGRREWAAERENLLNRESMALDLYEETAGHLLSLLNTAVNGLREVRTRTFDASRSRDAAAFFDIAALIDPILSSPALMAALADGVKPMSTVGMKNGMALLQHGRVSVLVFSSSSLRKVIGNLLVEAAAPTTRIAVSPDDATDAERNVALAAVREVYPLPPDAEAEPRHLTAEIVTAVTAVTAGEEAISLLRRIMAAQSESAAPWDEATALLRRVDEAAHVVAHLPLVGGRGECDPACSAREPHLIFACGAVIPAVKRDGVWVNPGGETEKAAARLRVSADIEAALRKVTRESDDKAGRCPAEMGASAMRCVREDGHDGPHNITSQYFESCPAKTPNGISCIRGAGHTGQHYGSAFDPAFGKPVS